MAKDAPKMKGLRPRDRSSGRLRRKREDTKVKTLQKKYRRRFGGHASWQLGTLLRKWRKPSLKKAIKR
ncbi:hypothetical protein C4552_03325 [Candidatus Parcubacteria bacterium]|nr:MAG: hypothetical protein C4552_03325 [Candidatus Parcubacteria bacterium]